MTRGRLASRGPVTRGRLVAAGGFAVVLALLTACAPAAPVVEPTATPVSAEQSELLAAARFRNFDAGTRAVRVDLDDSGTTLHLEGWFDYATLTGYAALSADDRPNALLLWDASAISAHAPVATDAAAPPPLPVPDAVPLGDSWQSSPLSATHSRLHTVLQVIASLGSDRPDNPLLLRQGGALALGQETLDDAPVTVFAGPLSDNPLPAGQTVDPEAATTRFWLDDQGVMRRAAVRLGGSGSWIDIDFADAPGVDLGGARTTGAAG
ncbi:hypothetical protein DC432_05665 [Microbacterium testaceum]|uniref:Uncharacterized protein n=1 Tax=Microbacterium testaceum TaxID=2033 RepID=A0A2T7WRX2_MICTE|nr:hypothetical protein DC432_05665 [Microbacterium testaceum]